MLLEIHALDLIREDRTLIQRLTLELRPQQRIALIGANGSGKSTLLERVALGGPEVRRAPGVWLAAVPQRLQREPGVSLRALARRAAAPLEALGEELAAASSALTSRASESELARLGELQSLFEARGGFELEARLDSHFERFALASEADSDTTTASAGALQLAAIIGALCSGAELLLLDEPTAHLDLPQRTLLAASLQRHRGGVLFASHDREFIERIATHTLWLEGGRATLRPGGYQRARAAQHEHAALAERAARTRRKRLQELDAMITTLRSFGHARAQARRLRAEREREAVRGEVEVSASAPQRGGVAWVPRRSTGGELARLAHLSAAGIVEGAALTLHRGDKLALVGPSGSGKSTLLELIAGARPSDDPRAVQSWRDGVSLHHIDQRGRGLDDAASPLVELTRWVSEGRARSLLVHLGLAAARHTAPIATLSGGERMRVAVALVMAREPDVLLIDEPTRELDLPAIETLQEALQSPDLTLIVATHDAALIEAIGAEVFSIEAGGLIAWRGGVQGWRQRRRRLEVDAVGVGTAEVSAPPEATEAPSVGWESTLLRAQEILSDPLLWGERELERWRLRRREAEEALLADYLANDRPPEPPLRTREGGLRVWGEPTEEGPLGGLRLWFDGAPEGVGVRLQLQRSEHGLVAHARIESSAQGALTPWGEELLLQASARLALYHRSIAALQVARGEAPRGFAASAPGWWVRWGRDIEREEGWRRSGAAARGGAPKPGATRRRRRRS